MRLGLAFDGTLPATEMVELARAAEAAGLDSVWVAEDFFYRDAVSVAAACLQATRRIRVACFVSPYTRHPGVVAMTLAALDELGGGRAAAIVGVGNPLGLGQLGIELSAPLATTEEFVAIVRRLLAGERLDWRGQRFHTRQLALSLKPLRPDVPLYLAAMRPQMMALARRVANGVVLTAGASPEYVRWVRQRLESLPAPGGHRPWELVGLVVTQVTDGGPGQAGQARALVGYLLRNRGMAEVIRRTGLPVDQRAFEEAYRRGGIDAVAAMVTDEILDAFAVVGPPQRCRARLQAYLEAGLTLPVLMAAGTAADQRRAIELLGPSGA